MNNPTGRLSRFFKLSEHQTNIRTEVMAGLTTFLSVSYILAVNPRILGGSGMPPGGVFVATVLASILGTGLMALLANYPFVLAPGMGLNAYFTYTIVQGMGYSWQFALLAVLIEGLIFLLLSALKIREEIFNAIPAALKKAVGAGLGLFITLIALQSAHMIVPSAATMVTIQPFARGSFPTAGISAILACLGVLICALFLEKKTPGGILLGILVTWLLGILCQIAGIYVPDPDQGFFSLIPSFERNTLTSPYTEFVGLFGAVFEMDHWTLKGSELQGISLLKSMNFFTVIFAFLFVDLFDTLGTLIGVSIRGNMLDKNGRLPRLRGALYADSIATAAGAILGTSTTTTVVESATGVAVGGRTGLTALTAAGLFLCALFFAPIFLTIPAFATAPALIIVGFYMMMSVNDIDFRNMGDSIPAYLCIIAMPFAYSVAEGISLGIISWTILNIFLGNFRKINPLMYILSVLFILKYIFL